MSRPALLSPDLTATPANNNRPEAALTHAPRHLAVIMDGNGRWAKQRMMPRVAGHKQGAEILRSTIEHCRELGIRYLTVYAFSAENWERPQEEVRDLMGLLKLYLTQEVKTLIKNHIRLHIIGDITRLPEDLQKLIAKVEKDTAQFDAFHLSICLSYGARQEMVAAVRQIASAVAAGSINPEDISEQTLSSYLYTSDLPDPDLLIRTGGEERLSNFLLWQSAYTELYFTDVLWPDFSKEHLLEACGEYTRRERRYGRRSE